LARGRRGRARQEAVAVDKDDIGGVVTGPKGPEAGVWVIAETGDLGTKFNRTVVTDDRGRYLIPDLPGVKSGVGGATAWWTRRKSAQPGRAASLRYRRPTRVPRRSYRPDAVAADVPPGRFLAGAEQRPTLA
jgi:hypothetical protein